MTATYSDVEMAVLALDAYNRGVTVTRPPLPIWRAMLFHTP